MSPLNLPAPLQTALFVGLVITALGGIGALLLIGIQIWRLLTPGRDAYVSRSEWESLKREFEVNRQNSDRHFAEIGGQLAALQTTLSSNNGDMMRAIGRLEGNVK